MKTSIIIGAGEITDYDLIRKYITSESTIICADNGVSHAIKMGITPNLVVGDFDSYKGKKIDVKTIKLPPEKDFTDTAVAIDIALEDCPDKIIMIGMLGGRFDHSFANIQTLVGVINKGVDCEIVSENTFITGVRNSDIKIKYKENKMVSVFAYTQKCEGVFIKNAKYELDNFTLTSDYAIGVSNEFTKDKKDIDIKVKKGTLIIILSDIN